MIRSAIAIFANLYSRQSQANECVTHRLALAFETLASSSMFSPGTIRQFRMVGG
jgi:hypothetical protein